MEDTTIAAYLGEGTWGSVTLCNYLDEHGKPMACKRSHDVHGSLRHEMALMAGIHHPNVVTFYRYFEFHGYGHIIMEAGCLSLRHLQFYHPVVASDHTEAFILPILEALRFLHDEMLVAHRDVTSDNIVLFENHLFLLQHDPQVGRFQSRHHLSGSMDAHARHAWRVSLESPSTGSLCSTDLRCFRRGCMGLGGDRIRTSIRSVPSFSGQDRTTPRFATQCLHKISEFLCTIHGCTPTQTSSIDRNLLTSSPWDLCSASKTAAHCGTFPRSDATKENGILNKAT